MMRAGKGKHGCDYLVCNRMREAMDSTEIKSRHPPSTSVTAHAGDWSEIFFHLIVRLSLYPAM